MDARLQALFEVACRANTSAILKIADTIAKDENTADALLEAPVLLRAVLDSLDDQTAARAATLLVWAMLMQHTATLREVERRRKLSTAINLFEGSP
jgi:hypothetical protein